ncbi:MAG: ParM/StbA family protein [Muribaculaceae bacterium]|nr:ParM/StbA family protein [Muribaculaceae bacterium]
MLIAVDHGNKQIKTVHCPPFVSGLTESTQKPFGKDVLAWQDKYYTLSGQRIPYRRNKTEDDRFFVLTLFAIGNELLAKNIHAETVTPIQLAIGLPPAHYGAQNRAFADYFAGRGVLKFEYRSRLFRVCIETVQCYPQAYSAAVMMLSELVGQPKVLVVDIGGFTADYLMMRRGQVDLSVCDSLENGVIVLYNQIRTRVNAEFDLLLDEADIDAILKGQTAGYAVQVTAVVEGMAQDFIGDLCSSLRERMLELSSGVVVFVGGGAALLRRQIEQSSKIGMARFVEDVRANAMGYELLYQMETAGR